jgi:membrane protein implicated in regulation of membrane protease activity
MDTWKDWLKPELLWFIAGLAMLLLEFIVPGLIIFFFGVGAFVVALICIFFDISINLQLLIFLLSSVLLLVALRRWLSTTFMGHVGFTMNSAENLDDFTGGRATVIRGIKPGLPGRVEFRGSRWDAEADEEIPEGSAVVVTGKNNLTLVVRTIG